MKNRVPLLLVFIFSFLICFTTAQAEYLDQQDNQPKPYGSVERVLSEMPIADQDSTHTGQSKANGRSDVQEPQDTAEQPATSQDTKEENYRWSAPVAARMGLVLILEELFSVPAASSLPPRDESRLKPNPLGSSQPDNVTYFWDPHGAVGGGFNSARLRLQFPESPFRIGSSAYISRLPYAPSDNRGKAYFEPPPDWLLNRVGDIHSNWIGRNRSGGLYSHEQDRLGQFPLGDTRVPGGYWADWLARRHDIEYFVSTHYPKGTEVKVPGPNGFEYYTSEGSPWKANFRVVGDVLSGALGGPFGEVIRYNARNLGIQRTPQTPNPVLLERNLDGYWGGQLFSQRNPAFNLPPGMVTSLAGNVTMVALGSVYSWDDPFLHLIRVPGRGPELLRLSEAAMANTAKGFRIFAVGSTILGTGVQAAALSLQTIDYVGKSMQVLSPPIYLNETTPWGARGEGFYSIPGGRLYYQETLKTGGPGPITRTHVDMATTNMGTYYRYEQTKMFSTIALERFVMHHYPVGSYFDPNITTMTTVTRIQEFYRIQTVAGVTGIYSHYGIGSQGNRYTAPVSSDLLRRYGLFNNPISHTPYPPYGSGYPTSPGSRIPLPQPYRPPCIGRPLC